MNTRRVLLVALLLLSLGFNAAFDDEREGIEVKQRETTFVRECTYVTANGEIIVRSCPNN